MGPTKLALYDFDGTLFLSPERPLDWASEGWWGNPASLNPPIVPDKPGAEWWNNTVVQRAKRDIGNPDIVTALVTGRISSKFTGRVRDLLSQAGLKFDHVFLSPGGDTKAYKLKVIDQLLKDNMSVRGVDIWEDRGEHLRSYADHVESKGRAAFPHLVTVAAHAPEAVKVAGRYLRAGMQSAGLFIPLPKELASQFPGLGEKDDSPTHCTLLIVGDIDTEDEDSFLSVVMGQLQKWPTPIRATLKGVNYFDNQDVVVAYDRVRFDTDMARLRSDLASALFDHGFPVGDVSPVSYYPHVTLAYMKPGSFGEYKGPVPDGSWSFDTVELWTRDGEVLDVILGDKVRPQRVAARYKKKTKDSEGNVHYEYSDRQIANRHNEKAERVEHLRQNISDLRARVKDDLKDEDPATSMTALAVALMDETCERVGNDESAKDGHFGVTGWRKKHLSFGKGKVTISYVGKSGVKHEKVVDNGPVVTALKKLTEGHKDNDCVFETDDATVSADDVNDYLAEFDITAKDIRGFRANDEMLKALKAERAGGPKDLPTSRKEKDKILKAEFKKALETVAEIVGHEAATLRSQYLVPAMEESYVHDGTVLSKLNEKRATKTEAEREDEAVEDLIKPVPTKKPPRHDLRNEKIETEDPDLDTTDDDLSLNYKDAASRSLVGAMAVRVAHRWLKVAKDKDPGGGPSYKDYKAKKEQAGETDILEEDEWESRVKGKGDEKEDGKEDKEKNKGEEEKDEKAKKEKEKAEKEKDKPSSADDVAKVTNSIPESGDPLSESDRGSTKELLKGVLEGQTKGDAEDLEKALGEARKTHLSLASKIQAGTYDDVAKALKVPDGVYGDAKLKSRAFDPEQSASIIKSSVEKRNKTKADLEAAKDALKGTEVEYLETGVESDKADVKNLTERLKKLKSGKSDPEEVELAEIESRASTKAVDKAKKALEGANPENKGDLEDALKRARIKDKDVQEKLEKVKNPVVDSREVSNLESQLAKKNRSIEKGQKDLEKALREQEGAGEKVKKLEAALKSQTKAVNKMTAYHTAMTETVAVLSKPTGSEDPDTRIEEAVKAYRTLPKAIAAKRKEQAEADHKSLTDELEKVTGEDKQAVSKKLETANAELAAAKFHEITTGKEGKGGDDDIATKVVRKFQHFGVDDPHIKTLLLDGTKTQEGRLALRNLAEDMSTQELLELAGEDKDYDKALKDSDTGKKIHPEMEKFLRDAVLTGLLAKESAGDPDGDDLDALLDSMTETVEKAEKGSKKPGGKGKGSPKSKPRPPEGASKEEVEKFVAESALNVFEMSSGTGAKKKFEMEEPEDEPDKSTETSESKDKTKRQKTWAPRKPKPRPSTRSRGKSRDKQEPKRQASYADVATRYLGYAGGGR